MAKKEGDEGAALLAPNDSLESQSTTSGASNDVDNINAAEKNVTLAEQPEPVRPGKTKEKKLKKEKQGDAEVGKSQTASGSRSKASVGKASTEAKLKKADNADAAEGEDRTGAGVKDPQEPQAMEGLRVQVQGLKSRPEVNGKQATVLGLDEDSGRWQIVLDSGEGLLVSQDCISVVPRPKTNAKGEADGKGGARIEDLMMDHMADLEQVLLDNNRNMMQIVRSRTEAFCRNFDKDFALDDSSRSTKAKYTSAGYVSNGIQHSSSAALLKESSQCLNNDEMRAAKKSRRKSVAGQSRRSGGSHTDEENPHLQVSNGSKGVFADASAMKDKVREAVCKRPYDVRDFYWETGLCQAIARSSAFDGGTLVVIALNAFWIAVDTDNNEAEILTDADPVFQIVENLFCGYFFFEWAMRFGAFQKKSDTLKDAWFVFDSTLVLFMVLETWVMTLYITLSGTGADSNGAGDASLLRLFRLLRLTRMARMIRLLRSVPELMILVKAIFVAFRSVFFTLCLLMLIIYVFAICLVQLTKDSHEDVGQKYFDGVLPAMSNLLLWGNLPDHADFIQDLARASPLLGFIIMAFIFLAPLTVMGMLAGVLVEVVSVVSSVEKEAMVVSFVGEQLHRLLKLVDADGNNMISRDEFQQLLMRPDAARMMQSVGVDVIGLAEFCDFLFKDTNFISMESFMQLVLQLRGTNQATVKDVVDLRKFIRQEMSDTVMIALQNLEMRLTAVFGPMRDEYYARQISNDTFQIGGHDEGKKGGKKSKIWSG
eukprot:TRINITY_DN22267_c0_g1_i1.p1 TRINITY_DN22267_c0_g1~~TRINITY_DN22267_c0_g1_i1.p1  ORF type:complete len:767 (-),score=211.86 TRINITY_DN22267_c0_g1_i1:435-2735(-)